MTDRWLLHTWITRVGLAGLCLVTPLVGAAGQARPGPPAPPPTKPTIPVNWDAFSADMTVSHARVGADGQPRITAPDSRFRLERVRTADGWKTTMTVTGRGGVKSSPAVGTMAVKNPQVGMRIEDAGDGSPLRFFDSLGREIRMPEADRLRTLLGPEAARSFDDKLAAKRASLPAGPLTGTFVGREWVDRFAIPVDGRSARLETLASQYGAARGKQRGLDRYLAPRGDGMAEILVDPALGLPVEEHVVEQGALVSRTTHEYAAYGASRVIRQRVRVERLVPNANGERTVTELQVAGSPWDTATAVWSRGGGRACMASTPS